MDEAKFDSPADLPVSNRLNLALCCFTVAGAVALLWLGSRVEAWYAVLGVGIVFSYLLLTNYALLHEATHGHLNGRRNWNYWLGVGTGIFFPVPFTMIHLTHQGHHDRNRTDAELFDLYYAGDNRFLKYWIWYSTLTGWFWPLVPLGAMLVGFLPRRVYDWLLRKPPWRNPSLDVLTSRERWQIRFELLLIFGVFFALFWLLDLKWINTLVLYACFAFNWSTRQYVGHAFTKRDVVEGAWNLRHNTLMTALLLNGNWDLNHHRYPEAPWIYLPRLSPPSEPRPHYVRQYWLQWWGPRLTTDPPPESLE
jgi:fatty acid desaturase